MKAKLLILLLRVLSLFPLRLIRGFGAFLGRCGGVLASGMLRTTEINLKLCFPDLDELERKALARQSIKETLTAAVEMGPVWLWPQAKIFESILEVDGFECLEAAYAHGKGVIVIGPHLGNWELMGLYLNACGCGQGTMLYQEPKDPAFAQLILQARSRGGARLVPTTTKGVAQILAALRKGEVVGILPDQVPPSAGGEFASFFGVNALTMTLLPRLLQKTNAKAVLAYARRVPGGFKIILREPAPEIYAKHMPTALQALNDTVEAAVREVPEQYQWEYKRFKRQPEGSPGLY